MQVPQTWPLELKPHCGQWFMGVQGKSAMHASHMPWLLVSLAAHKKQHVFKMAEEKAFIFDK